MRSVASAEPAASAASPNIRTTGTLYVESSALLRWLLEGDSALQGTFGAYERLFTSALTLIEVPRALARARREQRLVALQSEDAQRRFAAFIRACTVAEITKLVRDRAALEFPVEPVRSLDAIHLATVVVWTDTVGRMVIASCDDRVRRNGRAMGYDVLPEPPSDGEATAAEVGEG